jgi:RNA polymerase sigma-70 factor (ECF subfamily)
MSGSDVDGFEEFFEERYGAVVRAVAVAVGDRNRAEDLVQEAFARAYRRWRSVRSMDNPVAWVYVVALNAERKRWRRERDRDAAPDLEAVAGDPASTVVTRVALERAVGELTARQRSAVVLRFVADLSVAETARVMGCAEGTVKATVHQALRRLRVDLEGSES